MHEDNVFDRDNPYPRKDGSESTFDSIIHLKEHEEGPFDRDNPSTKDGSEFDPSITSGFRDASPTGVFDRDNPDAPDTKFDSITRIGVFDRDNPHQPPSKKIGVFDRDNPAAKCTDPLSRMGNVFPLICPRNGTGNRFSVPSFDRVPLTSDLEPDRSTYQDIDHVTYFQFLLLTGNFIDHVVYFQFLLLTGNLFVTDSFISCF